MSHYLIKFASEHGQTVLNWIQNEDELFFWCTRKDFPLKDSSIFEQWHLDPEIDAYLFLKDEVVLGYGEIWFDERDNSSELARILINPEFRKQGIASEFIQMLLKKIKHEGANDTFIRLIPSNQSAQNCYIKNNFSLLNEDEQIKLNKGESYEYIWMKYSN